MTPTCRYCEAPIHLSVEGPGWFDEDGFRSCGSSAAAGAHMMKEAPYKPR